MFRNSSGQINLLGIVGIGVTIAIASIGGYVAQNVRTDSKIEIVKTNIGETDKNVVRLETESKQYKDRLDSIDKKLDELIKSNAAILQILK